ncbi:MAG: FAD-dependent oxidoreductase [Aquabacterium sp.]|nr:MAG: FAD-dependent oxidoreductase [Aquabacterium sp.]
MSHPAPSRRRLLGGLTASAAAAMLHGAPGAARAADGGPSGQYDTEVVVVGGGYSGLAAARALVAAGKQVLLLEARDRPGGRCFNQRLPAPYDRYVVEGGAEFIGPTQDRMYQLVQQLGLQTYATYNTGKLVNIMGGRRTTYSGVLPLANLLAAGEAGIAIVKLESLAHQVPLDAPWAAPKAAEWDAITVQTWVDRNIFTADAKNLLRAAVISLLSAEPRDVSFLHLLLYIRAGGGLTSLLSVGGGAQQDRIVGGSQQIAIGMARELGGRVLYKAPVHAVTQDAAGIEVAGEGFKVRAQRAIVAMSPAQAARLTYAPLDGPLQARMQLMQRVPMGSIMKVQAVYDRPFWRDDGLNGQVTSDAWLPKVTFDNTPPEAGAPGVLLGFLDGQDARDAVLLAPAERKRQVIEAFVAYFGAKAASPRAYVEMNWQAENYSLGGPTGHFPPGVLTAYGPTLRAPVGRLHWAGTETATVWAGYMDGAVRSGERAAQEVLAR